MSPHIAGNALESLDYKIVCVSKPPFICQDKNISFLQACDYDTMLSQIVVTTGAVKQRRSQDFRSEGAGKNPGGAKPPVTRDAKFAQEKILLTTEHSKSPPPPPPPSTSFSVNNNITIAFVALFPISVSLFPMLHHEEFD